MKAYVISKTDFEEIFTPEVYTDETQAWRAFAIYVLETAGDCCEKDFKKDIEYLKNPKVGLEDIKTVLYDTAFKITIGEPITDTHNMYLFDEQDVEVYQDLTMFKICLYTTKIDEVEINKGE